LSEFDYTFKVIIAGDSGVGISTFLKNHTTEVFESIPIYKKTYINYKIINEISKSNPESKIIGDIDKVYQEILRDYRNIYLVHKYSRNSTTFKFKIDIDSRCDPLTFSFIGDWAQFTCEDSINTQPALNFVEAHTTAIQIIELFKKYGFKVEIFDDTNYYNTKSIDLLSGKNREVDRLEKVGLEFYSKRLEINNRAFKIQIWHSTLDDPSTLSVKFPNNKSNFVQILKEKSEHFKHIPRVSSEFNLLTIKKICKGSNGAIIMYDITDLNTFKHVPEWVQIIRESAGDIPILLIANKLELEQSREVSRKEGFEIVEKYNLSAFTEISTKTGKNVNKTFEDLIKIIMNHLCKS